MNRPGLNLLTITPLFVVLVAAVLSPCSLADDLPVCAYCGRDIMHGSYLMVDNKLYHDYCYEDHVAPRCEACGEILRGEFVIYRGKNYHGECYRRDIAHHCDLCGEALTGDYVVTFWGDRYCAYHDQQVDKCKYCGRFIGDRANQGGTTYRDGRQVCNLCLASAVTEMDEALAIMEEVRMRLGKLGVVVMLNQINLHLTNQKQISRHYGADMAGHSGFVEYQFESIGSYVSKQEFDIYILEGMPRMHFIATAAHELMHVWQYQNCPLKNDEALSEGSSNWAAVRVLEQIGGSECEYIIQSTAQSTDPLYGIGYRRAAKLADDLGDWKWLEYLKANRAFPDGY